MNQIGMLKNYLVIGAARSGVAVTQTLVNRGCHVILTDTMTPEKIIHTFPMIEKDLNALPDDCVEKVFGRQIEKARITEIDCIVVSPGVPLTIPIIQAAFSENVPVLSEVELAYRMTETPFAAITGTNGKTTTTTLTGEIFRAFGRNTFTVGNIGDPISKYVNNAESDALFVTEISSFQLQTCSEFHPISAAMLNLSPDHLDRHKSLEDYYQTKARIFMNQTDEDLLVLNGDDAEVCRVAQNAVSKKVWFSLKSEVSQGAFLKENTIMLRDDEDHSVCTVDELGIKGPHNVMNAMAAACLAYFCPDRPVNIQTIRETLMAFKGVAHRQERFAVIDGVTYINDSKGTNTDAAITALRAMTTPVVLIAGGYDKHEDYTSFICEAKKHVKKMILVGDTAETIGACAEANGFNVFVFASDFESAVKMAVDEAVSGDTVLLSPACASWDMFDNYEIRGELFKTLVLAFGAHQ